MRNFKKRLLHKLRILHRLVAYILIYTGESMLRPKKKYRLIITVIEDLLESIDVQIKVVKTIEEALLVRFKLSVIKPNHLDIDRDYFIRELALQLGCQLSDINTEVEEKTYYVEITKTAIFNMEKGCTPYMPQAYKEQENDPLMSEELNKKKLVN